DVGRAGLVVDDFAAADVHGVVEGKALADPATGALGALTPVLAVFLLEHAGRSVVARHAGGAGRDFLWRGVGVVEAEPPDFGGVRPLGQAERDLLEAVHEPEVREDVRVAVCPQTYWSKYLPGLRVIPPSGPCGPQAKAVVVARRVVGRA